MQVGHGRKYEKAELVKYWRCSGCKGEEKVAFEDEGDKEGSKSKFLCQKCIDKQVFCHDCHGYFKASSMKKGPLGERTVCGTCLEKRLNPRRGEYLWCERCNEEYQVPWSLDPDDDFFDIDVPLCLDCHGDDYNRGLSVTLSWKKSEY